MTNAKSGAYLGKTSKVDRYGWVLSGARGRFMEIDKESLLIPPEYQREIDDAKVQDMAAKFSWPAFGVVSVAERNDGFYVFDAGHRVAAAKRRADITTVPCMVYRLEDLAAEAQAFLTSNHRRPVTAIEKFKAQLITGDKAVQLVAQLLEHTGRVARNTNGPDSVRCIRELTVLARKNASMLERLWPLIHKVHTGMPVSKVLVAGLFYIEERMPEGQSLTVGKWGKRLAEIGGAALMRGALSAASYFAKGGAMRWAQGILNVLNKGLQNRLVIPGSDEVVTKS